MSAHFLTELLTIKRGPRLWELTDYLIFYSAKYRGYLQAAPGYVTNFGSIPRIAWSIFPPVDDYDPATVIHDAGYNNALQTIMGARVFTIKKVADDLFLEAMLSLGVNEAKAKIMYGLVHEFGRPDGQPSTIIKTPVVNDITHDSTSISIVADNTMCIGSISLRPISDTA